RPPLRRQPGASAQRFRKAPIDRRHVLFDRLAEETRLQLPGVGHRLSRADEPRTRGGEQQPLQPVPAIETHRSRMFLEEGPLRSRYSLASGTGIPTSDNWKDPL